MKTSLISLILGAGLLSAQAGDSLFTSSSLGKSVLQSNERLARTWFFEATGGPVFGVGGDLTHATESFSSANLDALNFEDIYGTAWLLGLRIGRQVGLHDVYFRFAHTEAEGGSEQVGVNLGAPVTGQFSDYTDFAFLGGIRREFMQPSRLHPYLGFEAGVRFVDSIAVDLHSPSSGKTGSVPFYNESAVFTAEVTAGISYDVCDAFRIGLESGLRYQGSLDEIDSGSGLDDFNNGDALLFVPLLLTGSLNF